ncbi:MAG: protein kinase [Anaerolineae bacterium]|nr:protein kinase [Anaerolineae bacterium]
MKEMVGTTLGKYSLVASLGAGGMATVYKAHQPSLDRYVAVKVLHPHLAQDPEFVLRFEREAAAVARLNHPGILKIYDFDADDGWYFMVTELIHGPTLKAEMRTRLQAQQGFLPEEIVKIGVALAGAIDYAHDHDVIHRDLKPSNVMLTGEGQVVLTDFGLAYIVGGSQLTDTGSTSGTPDYTSPEQALGKRGNRWSDIYSLGVILYEMAAGRLPFHGETTFATLMSHVSTQPTPPSRYHPDLPAALEDLILTAMNKDPADRYQSGGQMARALVDSLDASQVGVTPIPLLAPIPDLEAGDESGSTTGSTRALRPYRGLFPFREEDAPFFFGRETFVERLVDVVHRHAMVAVVGPSGNGKSSVILAGLLPRLRDEASWTIAPFRPGSRPFQALADALLTLLDPDMGEVDRLVETRKMAQALRAKELFLSDVVERILDKKTARSPVESGPTPRLLLVADQFEELYTLCDEPEDRRSFPQALLEAVGRDGSKTPRFVLALTLRADFMAQALAHRGFADALQTADVKLGPMTAGELRAAIEQPAARLGVTFEPGLVERILDDVGSEPGNLPLLEFALNLMWDRRAGGRLTHAAYEAIGRVEGALARYAEKVYAGLGEEERRHVRHILTQLVHPGEGTDDTRRLATRIELGEENWSLVRRLADERLVITGQDPAGQETVEVVHEALIQGWRRLREWMDAERDFRSWQERLRAGVRQWEASEHDEAILQRGRVLTESEEWLLARRASLSEPEKAFVEAGIALRERQAAEREAQRQRELEAAHKLAEAERQRAEEQTAAAAEVRQYARKLRSRAWLLTGALVVAALLALLAFLFGQQALRNENLANFQRAIAIENASLAEAQRQEAELQRGIALDNAQAAAENAALAEEQRQEAERQREVAVENAALAEEQRQEAERQRQIAVENATLAEEQRQIALSRQLAAQSRTLLDEQYDLALLLGLEANRLWDTAETRSSLLAGLEHQPRLVTILPGGSGMVQWVAFSPDGHLLASVGANGLVQLWRIEQPTLPGESTVVVRADGPPLVGHDPAQLVNSVDFSPDGRWIATASDDGTIKIWDVASRTLLHTLDESGEYIQTVAISPDGQLLAGGGGHGFVGLWNTDTWQLTRRLEGHAADTWQLAFSPDGQTLATASADTTVILWDVDSGKPRVAPLLLSTWPTWLAFSPDGTVLVTRNCAETDAGGWCLRDRVALWDSATGTLARELDSGKEGMVASLLFYGPDGEFLLTRGSNGQFTQWDGASGEPIAPLFSGRLGGLWAMDLSPGGQLLASANLDGTIEVWDMSGELWLETTPAFRFAGGVAGLAYGPGGEWFVAGGEDGQIVFVDSNTGELLGEPLLHAALDRPDISALTLHPIDGRLITTHDDGTLHEWVRVEGEGYVDNGFLHGVHTYGAVSLAMSVEGEWMATGTVDGRVYAWDAAQNRAILVRTQHQGPVRQLAFAPDVDGTGPALISGGEDGRLIFWVPGLEPRLSLDAHQGAVHSLAVSADAQWVASGSDEGEIAVWSLESGELRRRIAHAHQGPVLALSLEAGASGGQGSAGSLVSIGADGQLQRWDLDAGSEPVLLLDLGPEPVWHAAALFGESLVLGGAGGEVRMWNLAGTPQLTWSGENAGGAVTSLAYDGAWLFAGGEQGAVRAWDLAANSSTPGAGTSQDLVLAEPRPLAVAAIALDPSGETLLSVSVNGLALLWDIETGEPRLLPLTDDALSTYSAAFHPGGQFVAVGRCGGRDEGENDYCNQGDVLIWDLERDSLQAHLVTPNWPTLHLAFAPDGRYLASGGCALADVAGSCIQGQAIVWDLATGEPLHAPFKAHSRQVSYVAFSADSRLLAAASYDKTVTLWDVASGQPVGQRLVGHDYYALSAAFAPDGTTLATGGVRAVPGGFEGELILWDAATGQRLGDPLYAHAYGMRHIAYRPDGKQIVSASYDGTLALWDVDIDTWRARACHIANRNLTAEEWVQFFGDTAYRATCPVDQRGE